MRYTLIATNEVKYLEGSMNLSDLTPLIMGLINSAILRDKLRQVFPQQFKHVSNSKTVNTAT
jgi:hypothetical protein